MQAEAELTRARFDLSMALQQAKGCKMSGDSEFVAGARRVTEQLRALFDPTPLQRNAFLSDRFGAEIYLKREDLSPVRSYKIRGAFNAMTKRLEHDPSQTKFVCASAGNHAQGFAYACRHFNVEGEIFMPITTPGQKVDKTRAFGGDTVKITLTGDYFDQTLTAAQAHCANSNGHFVSPFDDPDIIAGQASVAIEILDQLDGQPDLVILPVGGGGLSAGLVAVFQSLAPNTAFRFIEPEGGASLSAALAKGRPVTLDHVDSFVDGAAVATIGAHNFEFLRDIDPAHVLTAPEGRICQTILELLNTEGIVLEPAGALSVDVLDTLRDQIKGRRVVCITSGGNFDFERLPEVKERAMLYSGKKKYFILRLPQRPGALRDFLSILGPDDDIAQFEYLKKSARNFGSVLLGLESTSSDAFRALQDRIMEGGFDCRDITNDPMLAEVLI